MANDPYYEITMAAANLKVAAPEQFDRLLEAFRQLEEREKMALIGAGPGAIFNAQGEAAMVVRLRKRLKNCLEQRAHYQKRV